MCAHLKGGKCDDCNKLHVTKSRRKTKTRLVELFGGRCIRCGYDRCPAVLQFHHRDPATKSFGIAAKGMTRKWEVLVAEAEKCDLLCANCHYEEHYTIVG